MEGGSGDTKLWFIYDLAEKESCACGGRCICEVDLESWSWLSIIPCGFSVWGESGYSNGRYRSVR